jgi:hypothetical protein
MSRITKFEADFYRGIARKETTDSDGRIIPVNDWSANNVRRLYFHATGVLVQLYVGLPGMLSGQLIRNIKFNPSDLQEDVNVLQSQPGKFRSILSIVLSGRVMSSLEEIAILTAGYPEDLLKADLSSQVLNELRSDTRFPRFIGVTKFDATPAMLEQAVKERNVNLKDKTSTLATLATELGLPAVPYVSFDKPNWRTSTSLRPQFYKEDGENGKVKRYFDNLKAFYESQQKQADFKKVEDARLAELYDSLKKPLSQAEQFLLRVVPGMDDLVVKAPFLSRYEWANLLDQATRHYSFNLMLQDTTQIPDDIRNDFKRIDFKAVANFIVTYHNSTSPLLPLVGVLEQAVDKYIKKEPDVFIPDKSMRVFLVLLEVYLRALAYQVYLAFLMYLSRNGVELVEFYFNTLDKAKLDGLYYDRVASRLANTLLSKRGTDAGAIWEKLPFSLENVNVSKLLNSSLKLLDALNSLVEGGSLK